MTAIHLFDIVSRSNQWLSVRQATIASNVANANTPGYKALDVEPFEKVMESTRLSVETTQRRTHDQRQRQGGGRRRQQGRAVGGHALRVTRSASSRN